MTLAPLRKKTNLRAHCRRKGTLRVTGRAKIVRDQKIRNAMADNGRMPELAMIVIVERAFFHCGKCITRSNLWDYQGHREQTEGLMSSV